MRKGKAVEEEDDSLSTLLLPGTLTVVAFIVRPLLFLHTVCGLFFNLSLFAFPLSSDGNFSPEPVVCNLKEEDKKKESLSQSK